jgi:ribosomal protein L31
MKCNFCSSEIKTEIVEQKFEYGIKPNSAILSAMVEVETCENCQLSFTGEQGENAREEAVNKYLKENKCKS